MIQRLQQRSYHRRVFHSDHHRYTTSTRASSIRRNPAHTRTKESGPTHPHTVVEGHCMLIVLKLFWHGLLRLHVRSQDITNSSHIVAAKLGDYSYSLHNTKRNPRRNPRNSKGNPKGSNDQHSVAPKAIQKGIQKEYKKNTKRIQKEYKKNTKRIQKKQ